MESILNTHMVVSDTGSPLSAEELGLSEDAYCQMADTCSAAHAAGHSRFMVGGTSVRLVARPCDECPHCGAFNGRVDPTTGVGENRVGHGCIVCGST